jgi:glyoxylase-like metal-dependent hydrolase (beta-lactamase superfamily II)
VLITGDAAQNFGAVEVSFFAQDFDVAEASLRKLAALDFEAAAFGHGAPITSGASAAFREACAPAAA